MAVETVNEMSVQLFTPYHQSQRGGDNSMVGTICVDAEATGDAGGGTVSVVLNMAKEEFGFPILFIPTRIASRDNLAAAEVVIFTSDLTGNRRLNTSFQEHILAVRAGNINSAVLGNVTVPIEGDGEASAAVFRATWQTNTDTKGYHLHMFGPVFDLQTVARRNYIDLLAAGVR